MTIKITTEIDVYEKDDSNWGQCKDETIKLKSHWNDDGAIVLVVGGHSYTVIQHNLRTAIDAVAAKRG